MEEKHEKPSAEEIRRYFVRLAGAGQIEYYRKDHRIERIVLVTAAITTSIVAAVWTLLLLSS